MRVLSIDWDYFVEIDPRLDYTNEETDFNLTDAWAARRVGFNPHTKSIGIVDLEERMPFRGEPLTLALLAMSFGSYDLHIAESHMSILQTVGKADKLEIINVDAHHDISYGHVPKLKREVNCGNWGSYLIQKGRVKSWTQFYPEWRKTFPESTVPYTFTKKLCDFQVSFERPTTRWRKIDAIFLCRSGTFTPPEYDKRFTQFCLDLGATEPALEERPVTIPKLNQLTEEPK